MTARVAFDCMVFLQGAARSASPARGLVQLGWQPQRSPLTLTLSPTKPEERGQEKTTDTRSHRDLNQSSAGLL